MHCCLHTTTAAGRTHSSDEAGQQQQRQGLEVVGQAVEEVAQDAGQGRDQQRVLVAVVGPQAVPCTRSAAEAPHDTHLNQSLTHFQLGVSQGLLEIVSP